MALAVLLQILAASPTTAADFSFLGPLPTRNFQPIQLIFLNLPFERAAVASPGSFSLSVDSAEINVIATTQGSVESELKFESNRTVLGARYGMPDDWEFSVHVPFISRYGGFMDNFIDLIEGIFGVGNVERDLYPNNSFGAFYVRRGDTVLFQGARTTFRLGDMWIQMKKELELPEGWPRPALRAAIKFPTGSPEAVLGSGNADFGLGLALDHRVHRRVTLYLNLNGVYPLGPITAGNLSLDPMFNESFAVEIGLTRRLSALVHQALYTSPMDVGVRLLDGTPVELGLGLSFAWTDWFSLRGLAIQNVSPVEPAADFSLLLSGEIRFGGADAD